MADLKLALAKIEQFNARKNVEREKCKNELKKINNEFKAESSIYADAVFDTIVSIYKRLIEKLYKIYKSKHANDPDEKLLKRAIRFSDAIGRYDCVENIAESFLNSDINLDENADLKLVMTDYIAMQQEIQNADVYVEAHYNSMTAVRLIVVFGENVTEGGDGAETLFQFVRNVSIDIGENTEITRCVDQEETSSQSQD